MLSDWFKLITWLETSNHSPSTTVMYDCLRSRRLCRKRSKRIRWVFHWSGVFLQIIAWRSNQFKTIKIFYILIVFLWKLSILAWMFISQLYTFFVYFLQLINNSTIPRKRSKNRPSNVYFSYLGSTFSKADRLPIVQQLLWAPG